MTEPEARAELNNAIRRALGRPVPEPSDPTALEDTSVDQGVRDDPHELEDDPITAYRRATRGH